MDVGKNGPDMGPKQYSLIVNVILSVIFFFLFFFNVGMPARVLFFLILSLFVINSHNGTCLQFMIYLK